VYGLLAHVHRLLALEQWTLAGDLRYRLEDRRTHSRRSADLPQERRSLLRLQRYLLQEKRELHRLRRKGFAPRSSPIQKLGTPACQALPDRALSSELYF